MTQDSDFTSQISDALPFLRRYARALTGNQGSGDAYAAATLELILTDRNPVEAASTPRVGLFSVFHSIWSSSGAPIDLEGEGLEAKAQAHMAKLTPHSREALLLHTVEEFTPHQVAEIMHIQASEAEELIERALIEMQDVVAGKVLIIEDEAVIAIDLENIVSDMGHQITGVARTRDKATKLAATEAPDLVLADIQLADNSSGIDAVNDILAAHGDRPVIFITAFPERLLTGERPEPAFLIAKPFTEEQVRSAVSQAMFFSSTETLKV